MGGQRSRSGPELRINGRFCVVPKREKRAENPFFAIATPPNTYKTDIYWGKGYFFLLTTLRGLDNCNTTNDFTFTFFCKKDSCQLSISPSSVRVVALFHDQLLE